VVSSADRPCVLDTSCLSIFARVGRVDLLSAVLAGHCFAAAEVRLELQNGVAAGHRALQDAIDAECVSWTRFVSLGELATYADVRRYVGQTGKGEAATVALAASRGWLPVLMATGWSAPVAVESWSGCGWAIAHDRVGLTPCASLEFEVTGCDPKMPSRVEAILRCQVDTSRRSQDPGLGQRGGDNDGIDRVPGCDRQQHPRHPRSEDTPGPGSGVALRSGDESPRSSRRAQRKPVSVRTSCSGSHPTSSRHCARPWVRRVRGVGDAIRPTGKRHYTCVR
jgi:predicted nucleic acid-binding protein